MAYGKMRDHLAAELDEIRAAGLYKAERAITTPQRAVVGVGGEPVLNLCANNYLGLADSPELIDAARNALQRWGFGMASVRFICGTQELHKALERRIAGFLGTDDAILYSSCFDANTGLFETLLGPEDAIVSDALNHASIIDGVRLCKAKRYRYANADMTQLEARLREAREDQGARFVMIATDGVFSMDGSWAPLPEICDLAERYDALVMVDDSHAVGFVGEHGRGTPELHGVEDRIDIRTGTLGKALGGASGGYTAARSEIVEILRQRSRPYLFSNSLMPAIAAASIAAFEMLSSSGELRERLRANSAHFRARMTELGFDLLPGGHPIIPVMFGGDPGSGGADPGAVLAGRIAEYLLGKGIYVTAFSYPVVPKGAARIRTQMSAAHSIEDLDRAADAFAEARGAVASST